MNEEGKIRSYLLMPEGALLPAVKEGLTLIEHVHSVPDMPPIPVYYVETARAGGYTPQPRSIEISSLSPHPVLTTIHESGHLLDDAIGDFEVYSSTERNTPIWEVVQIALESQALREMQTYLAAEPEMTLTRRSLLKWTDLPEIWARAYVQYIALRSGDAKLEGQIQSARNLAQHEVERHVQWQASDFAPIAEAIDTMMKRLRWRDEE